MGFNPESKWAKSLQDRKSETKKIPQEMNYDEKVKYWKEKIEEENPEHTFEIWEQQINETLSGKEVDADKLEAFFEVVPVEDNPQEILRWLHDNRDRTVDFHYKQHLGIWDEEGERHTITKFLLESALTNIKENEIVNTTDKEKYSQFCVDTLSYLIDEFNETAYEDEEDLDENVLEIKADEYDKLSDLEVEAFEKQAKEQGKIVSIVYNFEDSFGIDDIQGYEDWWNDSENRGEHNFDLVRKYINLAAELDAEEALPQIRRALKELSPGSITKEAARALTKINPKEAATFLLEDLRLADDRWMQENYSRVLFLMEMGEIGIDNEIVNYFDQEYLLQGEKSGIVDKARRITTDGKIGLFNGDALEGYIEIGDLKDEQKQRQAQILDITRDLLFANPDTSDEIREQFLQNYYKFYQDIFSEQAGVHLSDLSLREQIWLYEHMKDATDVEKEKVYALREQYGLDALRCFSALESDEHAGATIMSLAESKMTKEQKTEVFRSYASLMENLDNINKRLVEFYVDEQKAEQLSVGRITEQIARRAHKILEEFEKKAHYGKSEIDTLLEKVNTVRKDAILFSSIFREAYKSEHKPDFEDVRGLDFEQKSTESLSEKEKTRMFAIAEENYANKSPIEQMILQDLNQVLTEEKGSNFRILRKDEEIVSFIRFKPVEDTEGAKRKGHVYAGSFNVAKDYRGSAIGQAMMQETLIKETLKQVVHGHANPDIPAATFYMEKIGFNITGVVRVETDDGFIAGLNIECDRAKNKRSESRNMSVPDLMAGAITDIEAISTLISQEEEIIVFPYSPHDKEALKDKKIEAIDHLAANAYRGTRYFFDPQKRTEDARYMVFEKEKG